MVNKDYQMHSKLNQWSLSIKKHEAFEKCWTHSPLPAAARRCPQQQQRRRQRQRVTEGTAKAPWNGPKRNNVYLAIGPVQVGVIVITRCKG